MTAPLALKSYRFRAEREASWRELEALCMRVEERGLASLSEDELFALPGLYRATLSSLSVARAISLDQNVLAYLEGLCARAYVCVYGLRRRGLAVLWEFLARGLPALVWGMRKELLLAIVLLGLGVATGLALTLADPERFYSFVEPGMAQGRGPSASQADLARVLFDGDDTPGSLLTLFASFLFTHNAKIGIVCFALGIVAGAPTALLVFVNGLTFGAMVALHAQKDLLVEFLAWVLGHGVTELLAVCLCAAAGFVLGRSVVFPGRHGRLDSLALYGRRAGAVAIGAVGMFFVAALLEGFVRQLVPSTVVRAALASASGLLWLLYFWSGRRHAARELAPS
ncbi:MAG: stage II sporulation protein M [Myxococcales bacterium]|nr:stage II sporulation protein M [Myxococcales bacterium]